MLEEKIIIKLEDYNKENVFLYINDENCMSDIHSIVNFFDIKNNSIIPRYLYGIKNEKINFDLKEELEFFFSKDKNCGLKIKQTDFRDSDFINIEKTLKTWLEKNILYFTKNANIKIDISTSILSIYPYSIINKNEIHIIK